MMRRVLLGWMVATLALTAGGSAAGARPTNRIAVTGTAVPPSLPGLPYWPGWDIARAIAVTPDAQRAYVLDGFGGLHGVVLATGQPVGVVSGAPYWPGWDIARGLAMRDASSGWMLDGFGGIHAFGGAPGVNPATPVPFHAGVDSARGVALSRDGTGLYIVDRGGSIARVGLGAAGRPPAFPFGVSLSPALGQDVAAVSDGSGALVLDGYGGLHHVGVPSVVPKGALAYWPGFDIARGVALLPDRTGGYTLDGFGGVHPFALGNGEPQLNVGVFMGGLVNPWDLAFTGDGHVIYTERPNGVSVANADGSNRHLLERPADLLVASEAGAMGLALDPSFASNRRIYLCFAARWPGRADDVRLVRFTVNGDWSGLANRADIMTGLPVNPVGQLGRHSGCRPRFGPDGYLWVGTGDSAVGTVPQDLHSLGGKIIRIDTNGAAAADNPVYQFGADPRIYSFGHRNVQGLAFPTGAPAWHGISIEHGPGIDDEANRLVPGNFGWDPIPGYNEGVPMTDFTKFPSAVGAVWSSGNPTIAPSGATFLSGAQWRSWRGALAVGVLKGSHLRVFFVRADGSIRGWVSRLAFGVRLRTPVQGPDGNLYVTTDARPGGDVIYRVTPN